MRLKSLRLLRLMVPKMNNQIITTLEREELERKTKNLVKRAYELFYMVSLDNGKRIRIPGDLNTEHGVPVRR